MSTIFAHSTVSERVHNGKRIGGIVKINLLRKDSLAYLRLLVGTK